MIIKSNLDCITLTLFLTWNCNLNCSYCCYGCNINKKNSTSPNEKIEYYKKLFLFLEHNNKKFIVRLMGGEPTLFNRIQELIDFLYSLKNLVRIELNTNGTLRLPYLPKSSIVFASIHEDKRLIERIFKNCQDSGVTTNYNYVLGPSDNVDEEIIQEALSHGNYITPIPLQTRNEITHSKNLLDNFSKFLPIYSDKKVFPITINGKRNEDMFLETLKVYSKNEKIKTHIVNNSLYVYERLFILADFDDGKDERLTTIPENNIEIEEIKPVYRFTRLDNIAVYALFYSDCFIP